MTVAEVRITYFGLLVKSSTVDKKSKTKASSYGLPTTIFKNLTFIDISEIQGKAILLSRFYFMNTKHCHRQKILKSKI